MKKSGSQELICEMMKLKKEIQRRLRRSYRNTWMNWLQIPKTFWYYINKTMTAGMGVSPLRMDVKVITEAKDQVEMLNQQFKSAFSPATSTHLKNKG